MVLEDLPPPLFEYLPHALLLWGQVVAMLVAIGAFGTLATSILRHGPVAGMRSWVSAIVGGIRDLLSISPRRVMALARLAIQEAIHRKVLVAFGVFILILLFAGWFLDDTSRNQAQLYLSFVMTSTSYLVLLLALFLSVFSLPNDIAQRTIYTIVTKPVRPGEVVLGRIVGFVLVSTAMLVITGLISYVFVVRGVEHSHTIDPNEWQEVKQQQNVTNPVVQRGKTTHDQGHSHEVVIYADGTGKVSESYGHDHEITVGKDKEGRAIYNLGRPRGMLTARVPIYGKLMFVNREGAASDTGYSVGDEWTYRSYIEGGTLAAAVWTFTDVTPTQFPNGLPLEMTLLVFRTHKGDIERPIQGTIRLKNPRTGLMSQPRYFSAKEFYVASEFIPRKLLDSEGRTVDLFNDMVDEGRLEIEVKCLDPEQFYGMAPPDLYLRAAEASFTSNFAKGYLGLWLQMVLITTLGVMFSTFLNGAVAMLATVAVMLGGFFTAFIKDLASGERLGGGPLEAMVRLVQQKNMVVDLDPSASLNVVKFSDKIFQWILAGVSRLLPDFGNLSDIDYVANGYDIPFSVLLLHTLVAAAYLVPVIVLAFYIFRGREVAR